MATVPSSAGAPLHVAEAGSGLPLVALHGWSLSSDAVARPLAPLASRCRVLAPDLRGHGRSAEAGPFGLTDLAADVVRLFDALGLERAVLLGWSLGALAALAALPALGARAAALALVAGTPCFTQRDGWPHGLPGRTVDAVAAQVRRDAARATARFFEGMFAPGELDAGARARADALRSATPVPSEGTLLSGLAVLREADVRHVLPAVRGPALLLHGEADAVCPPGAARALAAALPGARLALLPGAGHAPLLGRPGACLEAIGALLDEVRA
jgi:pimeloyl-[acyl-carrier protein] methyl ester esterase